jgi:hypothetical protein
MRFLPVRGLLTLGSVGVALLGSTESFAGDVLSYNGNGATYTASMGTDDSDEASVGSDWLDTDTDDDDLTDDAEWTAGTDLLDTDDDGLADGEEDDYGTDATTFDTGTGPLAVICTGWTTKVLALGPGLARGRSSAGAGCGRWAGGGARQRDVAGRRKHLGQHTVERPRRQPSPEDNRR